MQFQPFHPGDIPGLVMMTISRSFGYQIRFML
jgi:hypothetical protein